MTSSPARAGSSCETLHCPHQHFSEPWAVFPGTVSGSEWLLVQKGGEGQQCLSPSGTQQGSQRGAFPIRPPSVGQVISGLAEKNVFNQPASVISVMTVFALAGRWPEAFIFLTPRWLPGCVYTSSCFWGQGAANSFS